MMTLEEAKKLLKANSIPFEICEFETEKEYLEHLALFPNTKKAKPYKVIAIIIRSENGKKDIELQFYKTDETFFFEDITFGEYDYEMFDYNKEMLEHDLLEIITEIRQGKHTVITANDIKKKRWLCDACYDTDEERTELNESLQHIHRPKGLFAKLVKSKIQYEIYNWNTYQCIIK